MIYEALLDEAYQEGLIVKEKPLKYNNGRIKGKRIAIRKDIDTSTEKACVLAEELGHHHTSMGNILDTSDAGNRKQERQARLWGYNKLIGLTGIIRAYEAGCQNCHEVAEYLDVTEEFLQDCIETYRGKYGLGTEIDGYYVMFIPNLTVWKLV
ncbi:ImmA/IrrE family metallo-endopeptidase [Clostridium sp. Marseille-P3244]|uniref:ImmA/IrrE family metallo-endopeptidase n=1 Tax=Clostridium sp. Marseille-P3244 TaxID=1871020 RepID=UPI000930E984|nr:ImmA/IrrE family metallo-endopeptidase [Clostridium sp. Marseille-P3244]